MFGKVIRHFTEPSKIDDSSNSRALGRQHEIGCSLPVALSKSGCLEEAAPAHGMNKVIGNIDPFKSRLETPRRQQVRFDQVGAGMTRTNPPEPARRPDQASWSKSTLGKSVEESAPYEASSA
jgi:hypothetical protein